MKEHELILTSILNCSRTNLYTKDVVLTPEQKKEFDSIVKKRAEGEPIQYLVGKTDFMGFNIKVDPRVLIPRPETEILVEKVVAYIHNLSLDKIRILDLGTGSGNIPISLAKLCSNVEVVSVDISAAALELAKVNAEQNGVLDRIDFVCADMVEFLRTCSSKQELFDIIVSNPPYIKVSDLESLPDDVKKEPMLALDGGEDGLKFYRGIIDNLQCSLKKDGAFFLEIGDGQKNDIVSLLENNGCFLDVEFINDYCETPRITIGKIC